MLYGWKAKTSKLASFVRSCHTDIPPFPVITVYVLQLQAGRKAPVTAVHNKGDF